MRRLSLPLPLLASALLSFQAGGCGDDAKRPLGDSCGAPADCASGLCVDSRCVNPDGASCAEAADCASGRCEGNICVGLGAGAGEDFFLVGPVWAVEDNIAVGTLIPGTNFSEQFIIEESAFGIGAECIADAFVRGTDGGFLPFRTMHRCSTPEDPDGRVPFTAAAGSFTIEDPGATETNAFGFEETTDPWTIRVFTADDPTALPHTSDLLIGQALRSYSIAHEGGGSTRGREINLFTALRQSTNATQSLVAGDWGFAGLLVEGSPADNSIDYNLGSFAMSVTAGGAGSNATLSGGEEFIVTQPLGGPNGEPITIATGGAEGGGLVLSVSADGRVELGESSAEFVGAVDPSGSFMMLVQSTPLVWPPHPEGQPVDIGAPQTVAYQVLVGLRKDDAPVATVAGRRYRIFRQALIAQAGRFGIALNPNDASLLFNADGSSATFVADESTYETAFSGGLFTGEDPSTNPTFAVSTDAHGALRLTIAGDGAPSARGWVMDGGNIIVMADQAARLNAVGDPLDATVGLTIGIAMD